MSNYQTLTSLDAFASLKPCAQACFLYGAYGCGDYIANKLGCAQLGCNQGGANSCITACVKGGCIVGDYHIDLSSAANLYNGYCTSLGYIPAETTTVGVTIQPTSNPPRTTVVVTQTSVLPTLATQTLYVTAKSVSHRFLPGLRLSWPGLILLLVFSSTTSRSLKRHDRLDANKI